MTAEIEYVVHQSSNVKLAASAPLTNLFPSTPFSSTGIFHTEPLHLLTHVSLQLMNNLDTIWR